MKSACKIKQRDITDCGVACLASIAAFYKLYFPVFKLRQDAYTGKQGTNLAGLIHAAEKLAFTAKAVRAQVNNLKEVPLPFIAHVVRENMQHYVVIYKVSKRYVVYMDPLDGQFHRESVLSFQKSWSGILLLLMPGDSFKKGDHRISAFTWFWHLIKPHNFIISQCIIAAVVYTILGLAPSLYIQKLVDHVLVDHNVRLLKLLTIIMLACLLMQIIIGYIKAVFVLYTGQFIDVRLIPGYFRHLLKLPQTFFDNMQVGEMVSRLNDAVKIRSFINSTGVDMLVNLLIVCFSAIIMIIYSWKLALMVFSVFPFYIIIYLINNSLNKRWQRKFMEKAAGVESELVESLGNIRTVKRFAIEDFVQFKLETKFIDLLKTVFKGSNYNLYILSTSDFIFKCLSICMLSVGSYYVLSSQLTAGELLSFYSLLGYFTVPATSLISANRNLQEASIAGSRLLEIIYLDTEADGDDKIDLSPAMIGDIVFDNVQFAYGSRAALFSGLNTIIHKGKSTAIVGESGSGKSTLLSLLQHIYSIQNGSIRIGDQNIKYLSDTSLRKCISIVPQEIQLVSGSIIDNIALGDYEPDLKKVLELSRLLGMEEYIEKLPQRYYTFLGESGMSLSGGQRQRLAIARALYREPEILLLDEATAALDAVTESKVQEALSWYLRQGKTLIIIAHRLSTIKYCDTIKVLKDGQLTEEGTHDELIKKEGFYKTLWDRNMLALV